MNQDRRKFTVPHRSHGRVFVNWLIELVDHKLNENTSVKWSKQTFNEMSHTHSHVYHVVKAPRDAAYIFIRTILKASRLIWAEIENEFLGIITNYFIKMVSKLNIEIQQIFSYIFSYIPIKNPFL